MISLIKGIFFKNVELIIGLEIRTVGWDMGEILDKWYKLLVIILISFEDLRHSVMTIVNNTILHT